MNKGQILQIAKPILFNTDMVRAILDDAKTTTRRIIKPQPILSDSIWQFGFAGWSDGISHVVVMPGHSLYKKAPYRSGEYLYVRETWCNVNKRGLNPIIITLQTYGSAKIMIRQSGHGDHQYICQKTLLGYSCG